MARYSDLKQFDFDGIQVGEELASFEYTLTQEQVDQYRRGMDDPEAAFPTLAVKHDAASFEKVYYAPSTVNADCQASFFNPPAPGKRIRVTGRVVDKYTRRGLPYLVTEATAVDEDGRLIDRVRTAHLMRGQEVGKKWSQQQR